MPFNRRMFLGAAVLTAAGWASYRTGLVDAVDGIGGAVGGLDKAVSGFATASFGARCAYAACVHDGYVRLFGGWHCQGGYMYADSWRTKDFVRAERSQGPVSFAPRCYTEAVSFNGRIFLGPGFDRLPHVTGDDMVTNTIHSSPDGADWRQESTPPFAPREACGFVVSGGYLYVYGGLIYNTAPPPSFLMHKDCWRTADGKTWELRNDALPFIRRSFAAAEWHGALVAIGGMDDTNFNTSGSVAYNDIWRSVDGGVSWQSLGNAPFTPRFGMAITKFNGRLVVMGGKDGGSTFNSEVWSSDDPDLQVWTQHADAGWSPRHLIQAPVFTVDGQETVAVIGGYNNNLLTNGGPLADIYTATSLNGPWQARTDSDF